MPKKQENDVKGLGLTTQKGSEKAQESNLELEKLYKPLAQREHEEPREVNFTNPQYYPEEIYKDFEKYLRVPLPDGTTAPLQKLPLKQEQSKYWFDRINVVGVVIAGSTLTLMIILLQETDLLNILWQNFLGAI